MSLGIDGGGGEGLAKTRDLRMQELIFSTNVGDDDAAADADADDDDDDSSFSAPVRKTSDRRTDPNMSCIV